MRRRPPTPLSDDPDDPKRLRYELGTANRSLSSARTMFVAVAAWVVVFLVFVLWMQFGSAGVLVMPFWLFALLSSICLGSLALMIVGAALLPQNPKQWTIIAASVSTLATVAQTITLMGAFAGGSFPVIPGVMWIIWVLSTLGLWALLKPASRVDRIYRQHPELKEELLGRKGPPKDGVASRHVVRDRKAAVATFKKVAIIGIPAVAVGLCAIFFLKESSKPPGVEDTVSRFADAVRAGRIIQIPEFMAEDFRKKRANRVLARAKKLNWHEDPPRLGQPTISYKGGAHAEVTWPYREGEVMTRWNRDGQRWTFTSIRFR